MLIPVEKGPFQSKLSPLMTNKYIIFDSKYNCNVLSLT